MYSHDIWVTKSIREMKIPKWSSQRGGNRWQYLYTDRNYRQGWTVSDQTKNSGGTHGEVILREKIKNLEKDIVKSKGRKTSKNAESRKIRRQKCEERWAKGGSYTSEKGQSVKHSLKKKTNQLILSSGKMIKWTSEGGNIFTKNQGIRNIDMMKVFFLFWR